MSAFTLKVQDATSKARSGELRTPHGVVETPTFMPVGTQGTVKTLTNQELEACGAQMILANVYHLSLRPGIEVLSQAGGLHRFMAWKGSILTDSGGYQVFSLAARSKVTDDGVTFASHLDGSSHTLTPEGVVDFQRAIGSDVVIPLDQCVSYPCDAQQAQEALNRTQDWAQRSKQQFERTREGKHPTSGQLLFGIVQGATYPKLRQEAASRLVEVGFDGYCLGGFSVGEPKELMAELIPQVADQLPQEASRYLMGMGEPLDLLQAVESGVDLFDCVVPTRHGRNGIAYTWAGRINLRNAAYRQDSQPVDPACDCFVCNTYSRMYIRHLLQAGEMLALRLLSFHNIWFYSKLMSTIRESVAQGGFKALHQKMQAAYQPKLEEALQ